MDTIELQGSALKRTAIIPETEIKRLEKNEIGIKSNLKGSEIKKYVDMAIYKLFAFENRTITLKAIGKNLNNFLGNACSKVLSIADIIRRKIKNLYQLNNHYSRKYIAKYESDDVKF
jgi:hypothetical protein